MNLKTTQEIAQEVARLHAAALSTSFLASLGHQFLCLLYESIIESRNNHLLFEYEGGHLIGFVAGGSGLGEIFKKLLFRPFALFRALSGVLLRPTQIIGILEILFRSLRAYPGDHDGIEPQYELYSIAVVTNMRGKFVAQNLYRRLSAKFIEDGANEFKIMVGSDLKRARSFYQKEGARPLYEKKIHGKAVSTIYVQKLLKQE